MNTAYFARLLCLSLAAFFLAHLVLTVVVWVAAPKAIEKAGRLAAREGARVLFALRLAPTALAVLLVAGVCAPSYFWLEPEGSAEDIGLLCVVAAFFGMVCSAGGIARVIRAAVRSSRYLRSCEQTIDGDAPVLMLAGVFRPRLVVSGGVRRALTCDELAVGIQHEQAHGESHDNLKRLLLLLAPNALPFVRALRPVECGWSRMAEWAADDRAVGGSRQSGLALASALVRVARMGANPGAPLATSLLGDCDDLAVRVERLLAGGAPDIGRRRSWPAMALALAVAAVAVQPATFVVVHRALEALAHP